MTKIAMITDTHAGIRNDSMVFHDYFKKSFDWFFSELDKNDIKTVIHLGDLFDRRKYINYLTSKRIREDFLIPLQQKNIECHVITGNHDIYWKNTYEVNALTELLGDKYSNISIYTKATEINVSGLDILLLPWITDDNSEHTYKLLSDTKSEVAMGHLELNGFEMFKGVISDHGVDRKIYNKFDLVFSGHFHHKSSVDNIHYIGAFGEYIWSDYNDPRGFTIFDTETRKFDFIQNPNKMFSVIIYNDESIETINNTDYTPYKDTYVKILCKNRTDPYAFDMMIDRLHKCSPVDISIIEDMSVIDFEVDELEQIQDTGKVLDSYINGLKLPVNSDKMKAYMRDVYNEAISIKHTT